MKIENFRCLGGSCGHQRMKRNKLFRSGRLCGLDEADIALLAKHRITHIIDLRSDEERLSDPYELPDSFQVHPCSALKTRDGLENFYFFMLIHEHSTAAEIHEAAAFIREGYQVLPFHNKAFALLIKLMEQDDGAILFHCSSGKDRTGVLAALVQKLLGVDDEEIWAEYLRSNEYALAHAKQNADRLGFYGETRDAIIYCCSVHEELLQSTWDAVLAKYANWPEFFYREYGLDEQRIAKLRQGYCEAKGIRS